MPISSYDKIKTVTQIFQDFGLTDCCTAVYAFPIVRMKYSRRHCCSGDLPVRTLRSADGAEMSEVEIMKLQLECFVDLFRQSMILPHHGEEISEVEIINYEIITRMLRMIQAVHNSSAS